MTPAMHSHNASVQAQRDVSNDSIPEWESQENKMDVEAQEKVATGNEDEDVQPKTDSQETTASMDSQQHFEEVLKGNDPVAIRAAYEAYRNLSDGLNTKVDVLEKDNQRLASDVAAKVTELEDAVEQIRKLKQSLDEANRARQTLTSAKKGKTVVTERAQDYEDYFADKHQHLYGRDIAFTAFLTEVCYVCIQYVSYTICYV